MKPPSDSRAALFEALVENAKDVITLIDQAGMIRYQSESVREILGYSPEELIGRNVFDYLHPDDVEPALAAMQQMLRKSTETPRLVCRFWHRTNGWRDVEVAGQLLPEHSDIEGILLHTRDVSTRQRTLAELSKSEELFQAAFNATGAICAIMAPDTGEYIDVNDAFIESTGWQRGDVLGRTEQDIGTWGSPEHYELLLTKLQADGRLRQYRTTLHAADGEQIPVLVDAEYLRLQDRTSLFLSAIDISERELIEARLRQSQKMEAIGQLAGGIAHDFNNLLSIITGHSELLEADMAAGRDTSGSLEAIQRAAADGTRLINRMMAFSRRQNLKPEDFIISDRIAHLEPLLLSTVGKDIELSVDAPRSAGSTRLDPTQFDTAIVNLVINARDAMSNGGQLSISAFRQEIGAKAAQRLGISPGSYVNIEVADTGHGMSAETVERAFEPFYTTRQTDGGSGLGLSMVFGFVQQSGGNVSIDSWPGHGTTISLLLPYVETSAARRSAILGERSVVPGERSAAAAGAPQERVPATASETTAKVRESGVRPVRTDDEARIPEISRESQAPPPRSATLTSPVAGDREHAGDRHEAPSPAAVDQMITPPEPLERVTVGQSGKIPAHAQTDTEDAREQATTAEPDDLPPAASAEPQPVPEPDRSAARSASPLLSTIHVDRDPERNRNPVREHDEAKPTPPEPGPEPRQAAEPHVTQSAVQSDEDVSTRAVRPLEIVLIEDNKDLRELLKAMLTSSLSATVTALASAAELPDLDPARVPRLLVTDVMLPGRLKGPGIASQLRGQHPGLRVLFMSGFQQGVLKDSDLEHPGTDFIQKPFTREQLLSRINRLLESATS